MKSPAQQPDTPKPSEFSGEATERNKRKEAPSADTVMEEIELLGREGTLQPQITQAHTVYDLAEDGTRVRQINADGSIKLGSLVDGVFVAEQIEAIQAKKRG